MHAMRVILLTFSGHLSSRTENAARANTSAGNVCLQKRRRCLESTGFGSGLRTEPPRTPFRKSRLNVIGTGASFEGRGFDRHGFKGALMACAIDVSDFRSDLTMKEAEHVFSRPQAALRRGSTGLSRRSHSMKCPPAKLGAASFPQFSRRDADPRGPASHRPEEITWTACPDRTRRLP